MMKLLGVILILSATMLTCEKETAGSIQIAPVAVTAVAVPDTVALGQPIPFETTCSTPTPCWKFHKFEITQDAHQFTVTVLAEYDGSPCIQILGSLKASSSIQPQERGTYTLRFWRTQAQMLEKVVIVR